MLLIILTAAVVAVGIVLIVLANVKSWGTGFAGVAISAAAGLILVIEIVIALIENMCIAVLVASETCACCRCPDDEAFFVSCSNAGCTCACRLLKRLTPNFLHLPASGIC